MVKIRVVWQINHNVMLHSRTLSILLVPAPENYRNTLWKWIRWGPVSKYKAL